MRIYGRGVEGGPWNGGSVEKRGKSDRRSLAGPRKRKKTPECMEFRLNQKLITPDCM